MVHNRYMKVPVWGLILRPLGLDSSKNLLTKYLPGSSDAAPFWVCYGSLGHDISQNTGFTLIPVPHSHPGVDQMWFWKEPYIYIYIHIPCIPHTRWLYFHTWNSGRVLKVASFMKRNAQIHPFHARAIAIFASLDSNSCCHESLKHPCVPCLRNCLRNI